MVANSPHAALPSAMPPCNTSKYMESARARIHDGDMVCAATFRQARIAIHATPLANKIRHSKLKSCALPGAKVMAANNKIATATTPSTESRVRKRGKHRRSQSAPRPNDPSSNP